MTDSTIPGAAGQPERHPEANSAPTPREALDALMADHAAGRVPTDVFLSRLAEMRAEFIGG